MGMELVLQLFTTVIGELVASVSFLDISRAHASLRARAPRTDRLMQERQSSSGSAARLADHCARNCSRSDKSGSLLRFAVVEMEGRHEGSSPRRGR
jgi:hypothetical protein